MKPILKYQTTPKPHNEKLGDGSWRENQDAVNVKTTEKFLQLSCADGASSSGILSGIFALTMLKYLPKIPLASFKRFTRWFEIVSAAYHKKHDAAEMQRAVKRKFSREGSCSTLTAGWISKKSPYWLHWLIYGDSPIMIFNQTGDKIHLKHCFPSDDISTFGSGAYLLSSKQNPREEKFYHGKHKLQKGDIVIFATDGLGEYVLISYLAWMSSQKACDLAENDLKLAAKFNVFLQTEGPLQTFARNALKRNQSFQEILKELCDSMVSAENFRKHICDLCEKQLITNDDSTIIYLKI